MNRETSHTVAMSQWLAVQFLCLVVVVTAGDCYEEVGDCDIRFEDNGACVHDSSNTAEPIGLYEYTGRSIKLDSCYCMYYDSNQNLDIVISRALFQLHIRRYPAVLSLMSTSAVH